MIDRGSSGARDRIPDTVGWCLLALLAVLLFARFALGME